VFFLKRLGLTNSSTAKQEEQVKERGSSQTLYRIRKFIKIDVKIYNLKIVF
jgi:hypothetical protein